MLNQMLGNFGSVDTETVNKDIQILCEEYKKYNYIDPSYNELYNVKRGLRNADGTGVLAGLTQICNVHGYVMDEGEKAPVDGRLTYRGIDIHDLINGCAAENRFGYEEAAWLLMFGSLPTKEQLLLFNEIITEYRELPENFVDDMIIKAPSKDIMNKLARAVLALYSYDEDPDTCTIENVMRQSIMLVARMPSIMVSAYQVKRRAYDHKSMYFHQPKKELSIAENILRTMRSDKQFTPEEAHLLDLCMILHAEHGGGNNSTFAARVLTSSGTDTFACISAAIGSLKGPRHGGANRKVREMLGFVKEGVQNWEDDGEVADFLRKLLNKEAGDRSGLIYGMGHAVYTKSDPRACILKENAIRLAQGTEWEAEFRLLEAIERLTPQVLAEKKNDGKVVCANVDLYSGMVYQMLGIPEELHTPIFAVARTAGWCAHRMEEMVTTARIMRPAYKSISPSRPYIPLADR